MMISTMIKTCYNHVVFGLEIFTVTLKKKEKNDTVYMFIGYLPIAKYRIKDHQRTNPQWVFTSRTGTVD